MNNPLPLLSALTRASAVVSRRFSSHGLSFTDFMILQALDSAPEQKLRRIDLADELGLTASGITRLLLPLEKLGIVKRVTDDADARARFATLTKAGKNMLEEATVSILEKAEDALPPEAISKAKEITDILQKIK
jgi:DNA-binding MarR family transcriptional regulator